MDKHALIASLITRLAHDQQVLQRAVDTARDAATHEESKAENKYDTRGLEASYLAHGQARRLAEINQALQRCRALVPAPHVPELGIRAGDLVQLASANGTRQWLFVGPDGAGVNLDAAGTPCTVITLQSPLGQALRGQGEDDEISLQVGGVLQRYSVLTVL